MEIKYRNYYLGNPPRPTKLKIPGWSGDSKDHSDGSVAQPWHCLPFVEGSTYGYEYLYPFKTKCHVYRNDIGELVFDGIDQDGRIGDFSQETWTMAEDGSPIGPNKPKKVTAPMMSFAKDHYGMTSLIDLQPPEGYVIRTEPHPRFYTDTTGTCPIMVVGHIQRWWSHVFFVVFKAPKKGEVHVFEPNEPCGQFLFVPSSMQCEFVPMTDEERQEREKLQAELQSPEIAKNLWKSDRGYSFNDKYKVISSACSKHGEAEGLKKCVEDSKKQ